MDTLECIKTRRSVRKYRTEPVDWDKISIILEAAKSAPSAGNLQNWKFIVVTDEEKRRSLAEACLQQYWMVEAPVHIIVVAEPEKAIRFYGIRGDRLYSTQNCAASIQNILLAANSCGLGSCWVGAFDENEVKRILSVAEEARPQAVITIGYADETPPEPVHYTLENVCFFERWGSRIKDIDAVLGHYGKKLHKHIDATKTGIAKHFENIKGKLAEKFKKKEK